MPTLQRECAAIPKFYSIEPRRLRRADVYPTNPRLPKPSRARLDGSGTAPTVAVVSVTPDRNALWKLKAPLSTKRMWSMFR